MQNLVSQYELLHLFPYSGIALLQVFAFAAFSCLAVVFRKVPNLKRCIDKTVAGFLKDLATF